MSAVGPRLTACRLDGITAMSSTPYQLQRLLSFKNSLAGRDRACRCPAQPSAGATRTCVQETLELAP